MNEMNGQFPWSESGMRCLQEIHKSIDEAGGYDKMIEIVSIESIDNLYKYDTKRYQESIRKMYNKVYCKDIPEILGISEARYRRIIEEMGLLGTASYGGHKQRAIHYLKAI